MKYFYSSIVIFEAFIIAAWSACNTPPTFWCDNADIAEECGVTSQCDAYESQVKDRSIHLTLLYEALCPGCNNFITTNLYPQIWRYLRPIATIELIPFGNARVNGSKITCQHGDTECTLNQLHSCGLYYLNDEDMNVPFIYCMEKESGKGSDPETALQNCFKTLSVKTAIQNKIRNCWNGTLGLQLQLAAAQKTADIGPEKHKFVPWILINDRSLTSMQPMQNLLLQLICQWYQGSAKPSTCGPSSYGQQCLSIQ